MKDFFNRKIIRTEDGSRSFYLPDLDEHFHSIHGAVQESKHVFMEMGWKKVSENKNEVAVLEIGFGTGLNVFLLRKELWKRKVKVWYTTIEAYPLSAEEAEGVNYFTEEGEQDSFSILHRTKWNEPVQLYTNDDFVLEKIHTTLETFIPTPEKYDLVFFDAFSPDKQPELWTEEVFRKMFSAMKAGGMLVTYCAKGQVRRNMQAAGFTVERLEGPPGKREMLRAGK